MRRLLNFMLRDIVLNTGEDPCTISHDILSQKMLSAIKAIKVQCYTDSGTVDYSAIKESAEYGEYRKLTDCLRDYNLNLLTDNRERLAFWINLYNTIVVDGIAALGIKETVKEVSHFFSVIRYQIGGFSFSPNDIEHGILRANAKRTLHPFRQFHPLDRRKQFCLDTVDPRIHFALVCGSRSCPPVKYYTPDKIDDELDIAARSFINSAEVEILPNDMKVKLSRIFKWYAGDFGGRDGVIKIIGKYISDKGKREFLASKKQKIKIEYSEYDWSLNSL